jgi:hypothetical protein
MLDSGHDALANSKFPFVKPRLMTNIAEGFAEGSHELFVLDE